MCPNFQMLQTWKDRLLHLVVTSQGDSNTLWISMAITWQKSMCHVQYHWKRKFAISRLDYSRQFTCFFSQNWPTCFCEPFLSLEKLQQQVVANPQSTLGLHTFFEGWRLTTTIILSRVSLLGWNPENGPLEKDSSAFFLLNSFASNHGLGIYTHNPGIEFTDYKSTSWSFFH